MILIQKAVPFIPIQVLPIWIIPRRVLPAYDLHARFTDVEGALRGFDDELPEIEGAGVAVGGLDECGGADYVDAGGEDAKGEGGVGGDFVAAGCWLVYSLKELDSSIPQHRKIPNLPPQHPHQMAKERYPGLQQRRLVLVQLSHLILRKQISQDQQASNCRPDICIAPSIPQYHCRNRPRVIGLVRHGVFLQPSQL